MEAITNTNFNSALKTLNTVQYTDMIALEDEVGNVVEFDLTGNENHVVEDSICIDGIEYELTEKQKDELYGKAYYESINN